MEKLDNSVLADYPEVEELQLEPNQRVHLITDLHLMPDDDLSLLRAWSRLISTKSPSLSWETSFEVWYENRWGGSPPV